MADPMAAPLLGARGLLPSSPRCFLLLAVCVLGGPASLGASALLLRASSSRSRSTWELTRSAEPVTEDTKEQLETFFQLQFVGMQETELAMPRSPMSANANHCVTAGTQDEMDGVSLVMTHCESKQIANKMLNGDPGPQTDEEKKDAEDRRGRQLFSFLIDGKIREKSTGLCIRRALCDDNRHAYDLGDCLDAAAAVWKVDRAEANSAAKLKYMGTPITAVTRDVCPVFCGPYRLRQHCKGVEVGAGGGCMTNFHAAPGWTKLPSQYVPKNTDPGAQPGGNMFKELFADAAETAGADVESVKNGVAPLNQAQGGICKSFVSDGPETESWFYFLRTSEKGQIYADQ